MKKLIGLLILGIFVSGCRRSASAEIVIARDSKSTFTIVIPAQAPQSVQKAAQELQKDIHLATGAELLLQKDTAAVSAPFLSVGNTKQAQSNNVNINNLPDEGFRIFTQSGNIYILGHDTPDGGWTKNGGVSNGTANGIYTFLEDYLNVRWLMPGDIGRDVPLKSTFGLEDIDRSETPLFIWRKMPHITNYLTENHRDASVQWADNQRVGTYTINNASMHLDDDEFGHNWEKVVPPDLYKNHPEWFAMINGKRVQPTGKYYKLETTNPALVQYYAKKAIETLKASERPLTFSLSPNDSRSWSESPESKALYDPIPPGRNDPSMSSLVLKWYHDVAQIVQKEYPQGKLAGYLYGDYVFPPTKVDMKLPDNFTPVLCGVGSYGYQLYKKENQERWKGILDAWTKVAPRNWFYYDLPNQLDRQDMNSAMVRFSGNTANVTPAAPEILNLIFSNLVKAHIKGALIYADPSWSNSALANYIVAKLLWNPKLDAKDLQREWLQRAYGEQAGQKMELFYAKLDACFRDFYQAHPASEAGYKLTEGMLQEIYAAHYGELEDLFLQARKQPMTAIQQQRLQMIEDNLIVLQWRLRNAGFWKTGLTSSLQRTDSQVADLIKTQHPDIDYFPGVLPISSAKDTPQFSRMKIKKVQLAKTITDHKSTFVLPGKSTFMIYAAKNGTVRITPRAVNHAAMFAAYILKGRHAPGTIVDSGILVQGRSIEFKARAGQDYYFYIAPRKDIGYELSIDGAVAAKSTFDAKSGILSIKNTDAPIYIYAANGMIKDTSSGVIFATPPTLETLKRQYKNIQLINLNRDWRFFPGDSENFHQVDFDDSAWKSINAGDWWQNQSFENYHGIAWYRKTIILPKLGQGEKAILHFSGVDGNAVVYINGNKLGAHALGNDFSGWNEPFYFDVTGNLKQGKNMIAVQVTSKSQDTASGINQPVNMLLGLSGS